MMLKISMPREALPDDLAGYRIDITPGQIRMTMSPDGWHAKITKNFATFFRAVLDHKGEGRARIVRDGDAIVIATPPGFRCVQKGDTTRDPKIRSTVNNESIIYVPRRDRAIVTCLRCGKNFRSKDRRANRLCVPCAQYNSNQVSALEPDCVPLGRMGTR